MCMWLWRKNSNTARTRGMGSYSWSEWSVGLAIGGELAAAVSFALCHSRWRSPLGKAVE